MGACASVPKAMRDEASAPLPEPAKEESVQAEHTPEEVMVEKEDNEADESKQQSLSSLLDEVIESLSC